MACASSLNEVNARRTVEEVKFPTMEIGCRFPLAENTPAKPKCAKYRHRLGKELTSKLTKNILARSEKITDRIHYGIICPEFFGHIKTKK